MAALKTRMKSLLTSLQKEKGGEEEYKLAEDGGTISPSQITPPNVEDIKRIDEIIDEIDKEYFKDKEVDTSEFELKKLGEGDIDMELLMDHILVLKKQDTAVYRKIYDLVFANYTAYVQELENVTALETSLLDASRTCVSARRQLRMAKEGVSSGGLGLLAKHKKRERLKVLLEVLKKFKTLQRARDRLNELLEEGDYPSATQLCIECQQAIETYKHFTCVSQLAVSLQDIQSVIETELEQALSLVATDFNPIKYELVQDAYRILGKTQRAVDLLLMKFISVIHDKTYAVVAMYVEKGSTDDVDTKMPYNVLCKLIEPEQFIECLIELCKILWKIMFNYYQVRQWHAEYDVKVPPTSLLSNDIGDSAEIKFNRSYVKQKLDNGLTKLWMSVQQKVRPYLEGCNMSRFQYDNFIKVLDIVNRLILIGIEFCGEGSEKLQESMRQQSLSYFRHYHRARLDELRLFLENEQWVVCPIRSSFSVYFLREFKFMRKGSSTPTSPMKTLLSPRTDSDSSIFTRYTANGNLFGEVNEEEETEDVVVDTRGGLEDTTSDDEGKEDEDVPDELKKSYVDEKTGDVPVHRHVVKRQRSSSLRGPVLANVTLTVVRFCGNYMQMMSVLQPIAYDVLECLTHLFDYYLYAVYTFFAKDLLGGDVSQLLSAKLSTSLKRINETLLLNESEVLTTSEESVKVSPPVTNPYMQLDNSASLYGLSFRIVAIESLVFLAKQFEFLLPHLEALIPQTKRKFLAQFYSQTVSPCHELRNPVYCAIAAKSLPFDQILHAMSSVKWEIRDIMSQHSPYVDQLLSEFEIYNELLVAINRQVHIPSESMKILWEQAIQSACVTFVEGFAQAKRCSNEGRALMQLDFQQFRTKMEKLTSLRPLPHHGLVEDYIKAYYMSETDLEVWLRENKEYTSKQLHSLIVCGAGGHLNKKSKQKLLSIIEEQNK